MPDLDQTGASTCGLTTVTLGGNTPTVGTGAWTIVSGNGGTIATPSSPSSTFSGIAGSTYTLRWTISNSPCTASSDDVVVTFNSVSFGGSISGGSTVCSGNNSTILTLSGEIGNIIKWQSSSDNWTSSTDIYNTTNSYTVTNLTNTTKYRVVVQNGVCPSANSVETTIMVVAQPTAPAIAKSPSDATVCANQPLTVSVTAGTGGTGTVADEYRYSTDNGSTWSNWLTTVPSFTAVVGTNLIESRRTSSVTGCNTSTSNQVSWTVVAQPTADDITSNVQAGNVCAGQSLSATFGGATGGTGTIADVHEYSVNGGTSYSPYTGSIATTGLAGQTVIIRTSRTATGAGCSLSLYKSVSWSIQDIDASVTDESDNRPESCPDFYDFNGNTVGYNAGYSIVKFRVTRSLSTAAWNFDYTLSGGTLYNGSPVSSLSGNQTASAGNNFVDMVFYIANTPGSAQTIDFKVTKISDNNCTHDAISKIVTHTISAMPAIGSFN